jgi:hypothetical protein
MDFRYVVLAIIQLAGCGLSTILLMNLRKEYFLARVDYHEIPWWIEFWFVRIMFLIVALALIVVPITYY